MVVVVLDMISTILVQCPALIPNCHVPLLHKNIKSMNAYATPLSRTFKLCTLQKIYNLINL